MGIFNKFFKNKKRKEGNPDPSNNNSLETILVNYNKSNNNEEYGKIVTHLRLIFLTMQVSLMHQ